MSENIDNLLKLYKEQASTFTEEQLGDISTFFSIYYAKKFSISKEEGFNILLNEGLPKMLSQLEPKTKLEIKKKLLSL
jgi:hypothetical protein